MAWPVLFRFNDEQRLIVVPQENFTSKALKKIVCLEFGFDLTADIALSIPYADYVRANKLQTTNTAGWPDVTVPLCVPLPAQGEPNVSYNLVVYGGGKATRHTHHHDVPAKGAHKTSSTTSSNTKAIINNNAEQKTKNPPPLPTKIKPTTNTTSSSSAVVSTTYTTNTTSSSSAVVLTSAASDGLPPNTVKCLYDYTARSVTELSFKLGQHISVEGQWDDQWWKGSIGDDVGFFPAAYVVGLDRITIVDEDSDDGEGENWQDTEYFDSYATLVIHHQMLSDVSRTTCYQRAVNKFADKIRGKIVLDIGCGSGILSIFCAKAGAKHVYAVDASDIVRIAARKVIKANNLDDRITTIHGKIEEITLPVPKVDVIISEWMGTLLVCESMIDSVLKARQLYLKPEGIMMPSVANLFVCPLTNDKMYNHCVKFWNDVYEVDMSCLTDMAKAHLFDKPTYTRCIEAEEMMSDEAAKVWTLDMGSAVSEDLEAHCGEFECVINRSGQMHGLGVWFDTWFSGETAEERVKMFGGAENMTLAKDVEGKYGPDEDADSVILSTSPLHEDTHWRQVMFWFKEPVRVEKGSAIKGSFSVLRNQKWRRHFDCTFQFHVHTTLPSGEVEVSEKHESLFNMWRE